MSRGIMSLEQSSEGVMVKVVRMTIIVNGTQRLECERH